MSTETGVPVDPQTWQPGREPGRLVVALGIAAALSIAVIDILLGSRVSFFFDLCFVTLCLGLAAVVRPGDFFAVGILPPIMMLVVVLTLAVTARSAIAQAGDGFGQAVITGLAVHSGALIVGYALCLAMLAFRSQGRLSELQD